MGVLSIVLATTGFFGCALVVLGAIMVLLAVKNGRDRWWIRRHAVSPCAALRPVGKLPERYSVYGRTVPGRGGLVVAALSGAEAVWFRTMVCSFVMVDRNTRTTVLWEQSGGDPFGVADGTGAVAVAAPILQGATFSSHLPVWARTRNPVGSPGPVPTRTVVDETTRNQRQPGPWLRQLIERGLIPQDRVMHADRVTVIEEIVPPGIPLHVIGKPEILAGGVVGLTLPKVGRYLALSRTPAETERILAGDRTYGMGCAVWATLVGVVCLAVFAAVAISITR
ncbi:hypothetical protein [Micromonospora sp. CPCC 206061]|uniref:hypothetical protein n=1 Tax=Micromonospora sp. CPCC 206061 TaxID=3122410 RepID=UPI002FF2BA9F